MEVFDSLTREYSKLDIGSGRLCLRVGDTRLSVTETKDGEIEISLDSPFRYELIVRPVSSNVVRVAALPRKES